MHLLPPSFTALPLFNMQALIRVVCSLVFTEIRLHVSVQVWVLQQDEFFSLPHVPSVLAFALWFFSKEKSKTGQLTKASLVSNADFLETAQGDLCCWNVYFKSRKEVRFPLCVCSYFYLLGHECASPFHCTDSNSPSSCGELQRLMNVLMTNTPRLQALLYA